MAKKKAAPAAPAKTDPRDEGTAPAPHGKAKKSRTPWREGMDFVVMLAGAVVIALLIKRFLFDVYLIPSGSMETALHGRPDGGDRIFCSKLNFHLRDLKRWEVAVFEFPYETARRSDIYNVTEQYKGQNFVKRVIGLPGESLAIGRGDIWIRAAGSRGEYERMVKPDQVQRGMWLNVYAEDFSDLKTAELGMFWRAGGEGTVDIPRRGALVMSPGEGKLRLDYRPMLPTGMERDTMRELPGIPDRYILEQPMQFKCQNILPDGNQCGHVYVKTIRTQNVQARCPACGSMQDETSVIFYHRRSGLAAVGTNAVNPANAPQGEDVAPRQTDYHLVPDLRVVTDVTFGADASRLSIVLGEDSRRVEALLAPDGRVEILANGQQSNPMERAVADLRTGVRHRVEFYILDGTARLFIDSTEKALLDIPVWRDKRPMPKNIPRTTGVALAASGGAVTLESVAIDRDIFYYSGWEFDRGEKFPQMNSQGEVHINNDSFFPMGDHCPSSFDARSWGPVPQNLLRGPAMFIWWPPERIGVIPSPP